MPTPHKHAELIKAWADGAEIESKIKDKWERIFSPCWSETTIYRIKPKQPDFATIVKEAWYKSFRNNGLEDNASMIAWKAAADAVIKAYKESAS